LVIRHWGRNDRPGQPVLLSDEVSFITGPNLVVDGKRTVAGQNSSSQTDDRDDKSEAHRRHEFTLNSIENAKVIWEWGVNVGAPCASPTTVVDIVRVDQP
jgi:hypothetical protein